MRKIVLFSMVVMVGALLYACSLNNDIIKPACQVFKSELTERWWYPDNEAASTAPTLFFTREDMVKQIGMSDSVTFDIDQCNKLSLINHQTETLNTWSIVSLTPSNMALKMNGEVVYYSVVH